MRRQKSSRRRVSATEAAKTFGGLVDRVREEGASFTVERGGVPVAEIRPLQLRSATVGDLITLLSARRHPLGDAFGEAVTAAVRAANRRRVLRNPWASSSTPRA
jgi:antitoxin (DNA-binding transcriptional repressor) of toxin-antitoxin stability system